MATVELQVPPLVEGQRLSRDEFLRRWEAMPNLKRVELVKGVVHMPSPLSLEHGNADRHLGGLLFLYSSSTPGTTDNRASTHLMLGDAPQPDLHLRIDPEAGGQSKGELYVEGCPELLCEISGSSASRDLGDKFDLYEEAGVLEYLVVLIHEHEFRWFHRQDGTLQLMPEPTDGIWRSKVFPGLWIDGPAYFTRNTAKTIATLQQGIQSPEHAAFVEELARRLKP